MPRGTNSDERLETGEAVRDALQVAGVSIPDRLLPVVVGEEGEGPSILIESAEGVTTFPGFGDDEVANGRMTKKLKALTDEIRREEESAGANGSKTP